MLDIYDEIDETKNACAMEFIFLTGTDTPSEVLRPFLGLLVRDSSVRMLVPSILGRMYRCNNKDQQELGLVVGPLLELMLQQAKGALLPPKTDISKATEVPNASMESTLRSRLATTVTGSIDQIEYLLISYSELWAKPSPNETELEKFYKDGVFSLGSSTLEQYCLLSGNLNPALSMSERDPACNQVVPDVVDAKAPNSTRAFTYALDEFSNQTAPVPPNTSLLVINGGLDFQTPWEFGRHQFESAVLSDRETSRKMLLEFDFGAHVCGLSATTTDDETLCGPGIVASFIANSGDPDAVDTSCMAKLPELSLTDNVFSMLVEVLIETQREQMLGGGFGFGK